MASRCSWPTSLGDTVLIDVERWDGPHDGLEPFNGQLDGVTSEDLMRVGLSAEQVSRFAAQVVGVDNVPLRALASLPLVGRVSLFFSRLADTDFWIFSRSASVAASKASRLSPGDLTSAEVR